MKPVFNCENVEIVVKNQQSKNIFFPIKENLDNNIITRIDALPRAAYSSTVYGIGNKTLVAAAIQRKAFLVLVKNNREIYSKIPLLYFLSDQNNGFRFEINSKIDFDKSYIYYDSPSSLTVDQVFSFQIFYQKPNEKINSFALNFFNRPLNLNHEIIECTIDNATKSKFYFPDNDQLRNKRIFYINTEDPTNYGYSPFGNTKIAASVFYSGYVTIVDRFGKEVISNMPLCMLRSTNNFLKNMIVYNDLSINWPKSYVSFPNSVTLTSSRVITFSVFYL